MATLDARTKALEGRDLASAEDVSLAARLPAFAAAAALEPIAAEVAATADGLRVLGDASRRAVGQGGSRGGGSPCASMSSAPRSTTR